MTRVISRRGVRGRGREYYNNMGKKSSLHTILQAISRLLSISTKLNGIFSRDNLPKIKDGAYVINLDGRKSKGALCISFFTRVCYTHFIIFSFRAGDLFPEEIFWRQLAIQSPEYHSIMGTKCEH